jgi:hypothetical protein
MSTNILKLTEEAGRKGDSIAATNVKPADSVEAAPGSPKRKK